MGQVWDADVDLSIAGAAELVERQFPELAPVRIEPIGQGWDNTAYLINGAYVFRFPRRALAVGLLANESKCLAAIRPHVSLPIPEPVFEGQPANGYPYPFAGYKMLPGEPACHYAWTALEGERLAEPLARFLGHLHSIPVDEEIRAWAPGDILRRADVSGRVPKVIERIDSMRPLLARHGLDPDSLIRTVRSLANAKPSSEPSCWVHGDFYPCHFLVDDQKSLSGVIDWGDIHLGDRAGDLSIAFTFMPAAARARFWDVYAAAVRSPYGVNADLRARALFRAMQYGETLLRYGEDQSKAHMARLGREILAANDVN